MEALLVLLFSVAPFEGRRLRARRIHEEIQAKRVGQRAQKEDSWIIDIAHGGGVAGSYGYYAETECVLAISDPLGNVAYWCGRASANGISERKAAMACVSGVEDLFDGRVKNQERIAYAWEIAKALHQEAIPPLVVLAATAE
jgi:hypothetical protein